MFVKCTYRKIALVQYPVMFKYTLVGTEDQILQIQMCCVAKRQHIIS
jgi:hypothetical protein